MDLISLKVESVEPSGRTLYAYQGLLPGWKILLSKIPPGRHIQQGGGVMPDSHLRYMWL